jgi:hypothetical protein
MTRSGSRRLGSNTARCGFKNEHKVIARFNQWHKDLVAQNWLVLLGHRVERIVSVRAKQITGSYKADISVEVEEESRSCLHFIQVKLVSNLRGYNQIDKRWVDRYSELWNIPSDIEHLLKLYTGYSHPTIKGRDHRRMFADEFSLAEQKRLVGFFYDNKATILRTIFAGEDEQAAQWWLVIQKANSEQQWSLWPIDRVINFFGEGEILITERGNIRMGKITIQRKGGDGGRETSKMLQFKINPAEILLGKNL